MTREELICHTVDDVVAMIDAGKDILVEEKMPYPFPPGFLLYVKDTAVSAGEFAVEVGIREGYGTRRYRFGNAGLRGRQELEDTLKELLEWFAKMTYLAKNPLKAPTRKSRARYRPGEPVSSIDELLSVDFVYFQGKITHREIILSWQYRMVMRAISEKWLHYAVKKEETDES